MSCVISENKSELIRDVFTKLILMDCHVQKKHTGVSLEQVLTVFSCTVWSRVNIAMSVKFFPREYLKKKERTVLKQRHGGMDRREDGPRPAQPKSSNTQLDECLRCQQLQGTGVDQDLAVTCKDKKKKSFL